MTKTTFKIVRDHETDVRYITRGKDETKNHKAVDQDINAGYMPEMPGSKYCLVQSYLTYLYSLDKKSNFLWQHPKMKHFPADGKGTWYGPQRVGHNPLKKLRDICQIVSSAYLQMKMRLECSL